MEFSSSIQHPNAPIHVCLGDLFDKASVSYDLIFNVYMEYHKASKMNPNTTYYILKGNHDYLRDLERISAFDLLAELLMTEKNIIIITNYLVVNKTLLCAWQPVKTAAELVSEVKERGITTAFGHWDIEDYGSEVPNLIPLEALAKLGVKTAITGHVHKASEFTKLGVDVVVWGSMQPFAHGEEPDDSLYVTLTLDEAKKQQATLANKCVRVLLKPDEKLDFPLNCLQLVQKVVEDKTSKTISQVQLGEFDMEELFKQAFESAKVSKEIQDRVLLEFRNRRMTSD